MKPAEIGTEVFFFPAAGHAEKDGCFTNTRRLLQWHEKAVDPPGEARSETWFIYQLGRRLKERALRDSRPRNAGLAALTWDYTLEGPHGEPRIEEILAEINGFRWSDRRAVSSYTELAADGSTACGCWIYSGVLPAPGENHARERHVRDAYGHGWGFAWPSDRRILYNRASARPDGRPWSERKKLVWWDDAARRWTGLDVPDFAIGKAPDYRPADDATGDAALAGDKPFLLHPDGLGWLWVPAGLRDGPLPTHYEPLESPVRHPLYSTRQTNPAADAKAGPENAYADSPDPRFPYVLTTYRLTEHHTAGGMSRTLPHLAELQPEMFCEISPELAAECDVRHGEWVTVVTARGLVEARAIKEKVHFREYIPAEDLPIVYNLADVFVYPSLYEGFGLPPLEAMACGTPVITTAVSSMPEHVGEAGILIPPPDERALFQALLAILQDPDLRRQLSEKGPARAAHYSWNRTALETLNVYRRVQPV